MAATSDQRTLRGMDLSTKTDLYAIGRIGYCPRCDREFIKRKAWSKGKCGRCGLPLTRHDTAYSHTFLRKQEGRKTYVPLAAATIGTLVRELRRRLGMTARSLAGQAGLGVSTIYAIEQDHPVRADTLRRVFRLARKHRATSDIAVYLEERLRAAGGFESRWNLPGL